MTIHLRWVGRYVQENEAFGFWSLMELIGGCVSGNMARTKEEITVVPDTRSGSKIKVHTINIVSNSSSVVSSLTAPVC